MAIEWTDETHEAIARQVDSARDHAIWMLSSAIQVLTSLHPVVPGVDDYIRGSLGAIRSAQSSIDHALKGLEDANRDIRLIERETIAATPVIACE